MSALGQKADILQRNRHVRFTPESDIANSAHHVKQHSLHTTVLAC